MYISIYRITIFISLLSILYIGNIKAQVWQKTGSISPELELTNYSDKFGSAVAIDGDFAIVGAAEDSENGYNTGTAYVLSYDGASWSKVAKLQSSTPEVGEGFGKSVAISGNTIVIGAYNHGVNGEDSGLVYVFEKPSGGWEDMTETALLLPSIGDIYDWFGYSVGISGETIAVGAPYSDYASASEGALFVFLKPQAGWSGTLNEVAILSASNGGFGTNLGHSIEIDEETIVSGALGFFDGGSIYVYEKPNSGWVDSEETAILKTEIINTSISLGYSIGLSGNYIASGAWHNSGFQPVYVFEKSETGWESGHEIAQLTPLTQESGSYFGRSLAMANDNIIVGEYNNEDGGILSGALYVFEMPGSGWEDINETAKLFASDPLAFDQFGFALAISGDHIIVSSASEESGAVYTFEQPITGWENAIEDQKVTPTPYFSIGGNVFGRGMASTSDIAVIVSPGISTVHVFEKNEDDWDHLADLTISGEDLDVDYGKAVAIYNDVIVVSASGDDDNGSTSGAVYLFEKPNAGWEDMTETTKILASDGAAGDRFGSSVDIDGDFIVVGAFANNDVASDAGSLYVFEKPVTGWQDVSTEIAILTASDGQANDFLGRGDVSIKGDIIVGGAYSHDDSGSNNGAAYLFEKPVSGWTDATETAKFTIQNSSQNEYLGGNALEIFEDMVLVAARGYGSSGGVFIYNKPASGWVSATEDIVLTPTDGDNFGSAIGTSDNLIVVGDNGASNYEGAVYIFEEPVDGWETSTETFKLTIDEYSGIKVSFGENLVIVNDEILIGAPFDREYGYGSGRVHVFSSLPNFAPEFTAGEDQVVNEDAGAQSIEKWANNINDGEGGDQELTFSISNDNNDLFETQPSVNESTGDLTFTPADGAYGTAVVTISLSDNGGTENAGNDTSSEVTFNITVNSVNDVPSFITGADQAVLEDAGSQAIAAWATEIMDGEGNTQMLTFNTSNDNNDLFDIQPSIDESTGDLTYTPADDANGSATITVTLSDDGGTENAGIDTTEEITFTIEVEAVNDAPSYVAGDDQSLNEDAGTQTIEEWATDISDGDEGGQTLAFQLSNDNNSLFSAQPSVSSQTGNLSFTPAENAYGIATVTINLTDNMGTANGGANTSEQNTFTIEVLSVNDAPSFTKGEDQQVVENAGNQTVSGWATNMDDGESGIQVLTFNISNDNNDLFAVQPMVDEATGNLSYTPATDTHGTATVTLSISDDGGTVHGGIDVSDAVSFTITVSSVNQTPSFTAGADQVITEDAESQTVLSWASNIDDNDGGSQNLTFVVSNDNNALFASQPSIDESTGNLTYTTAPDANGSATVTVSLRDDGGTENDGVDRTEEITFSIEVISVNDAPTLTLGNDQEVNEDAGTQTISGWASNIADGDNGSQNIMLVISNDNTGLFTDQPIIDMTSGDLSFTPANNTHGQAIVTISIQDDGGTENEGVDSSEELTFVITVSSVNDKPSFTIGLDQLILEDQGAQMVSNYVTNITDGDDGSQNLTFLISNNNNDLFSQQPTVDVSTGNLSYFVANNAFGTATVTISLQDDGGTENGGVDTTQDLTFTITATSVNDAPSFTIGADQVVDEDAGAQRITTWATAIRDGDNGSQSLSFIISNDNIDLFSVQPNVDETTGDLTFTPAENANGQASVTISVQDDGSTENGGINSSEQFMFVISVNPVNDAPSSLSISNSTIDENLETGSVIGTISAIDVDSNTLTYILDGNDASFFEIVSDDIVSAIPFDFETQSTYSISIIAQDSEGLSVTLELTIMIIDVFEEDVLNVINYSNENSLSLYPNPNKGLVFITFDDPNIHQASLELYRLNGRLLDKISIEIIGGSTSYILPNIGNGTYFIKIIGNDQTSVFKRVVIVK